MIKKKVFPFAVLLSCVVGISEPAISQDEGSTTAGQPAEQAQILARPGTVIVPESSVVRPEDAGVRFHTNHLIFVPSGREISSVTPDTAAETPYSMACVYGVGTPYAGCKPSSGDTASLATGGWGAIALVDAYDNPNAASDLATFSSHFGLAVANFTKVYANTSFGSLNGMTASCSGTPPGNTDWGTEESLDIEWAHAMAPDAKIILVEACSSSYTDLFFAEQVAGKEVTAAGGGDISNSWGGGEFVGEVGTVDDVFYRYYPFYITYFASAGDSGWGAGYPSSSPWVVSAGGTTVNRDTSGNFVSESCWSRSGGGVSAFEIWQSPPSITDGMGPWANFQYPLSGYIKAARLTPDMSFNSDPSSGVQVYDTYGYKGWLTIGGTSVASPSLAGIVNSANNRLGQAPPTAAGHYQSGENNLIYAQLGSHTAYATNFYDVKTGSNGTGHNAGPGYDECTGVGSPRGKLGK